MNSSLSRFRPDDHAPRPDRRRPGPPGRSAPLLALCLMAAGGLSSAAEPATATPPSGLRRFLQQDYLLGDWGGLRTNLAARGVEFEFLYSGGVAANLDGGLRRGSVYEGAFLLMLDLDSEKLAGYPGGKLHAGSIQVHGKRFSENYVGDLNQVSLLDYAHGFRLWELWYEQTFCEGKVALKAGQLAIDRDFLTPDYYSSFGQFAFLNQTFFYPTMAFNVFDQPGFPPGRHGLASTPYGAPGVRLRVDLTPKYYAQAGVYDGNPDRSYTGTRLHLDRQEGALAYFEVGYRLNQAKEATGAPGSYKVGGYYHTDEFYDTYEATRWAVDSQIFPGTPLPSAHNGNYGLYFLADQMLWREQGREDPARQGLIAFGRVAGAPADRNLAQWGLDGGLVYRGLIPSRDWDTLGVGLSYLRISDELRRGQQDVNALYGDGTVPVADGEGALELNYRIQITPWWVLQLSSQRVFHPGGRVAANTPDAWVCILQSILRL